MWWFLGIIRNCTTPVNSSMQLTMSPFDPYGTLMSRKFHNRLLQLLDDSVILTVEEKTKSLTKIAFISECCRIQHDKYFPSVQLPPYKKRNVDGQLTTRPFDPYWKLMSRKFQNRLLPLLDDSLILTVKGKTKSLLKIAFISECCRRQHANNVLSYKNVF